MRLKQNKENIFSINFDFLIIMNMINYSVIFIIPFLYLSNDKTRRQIKDLIQKNEIEYQNEMVFQFL